MEEKIIKALAGPMKAGEAAAATGLDKAEVEKEYLHEQGRVADNFHIHRGRAV